ncbi:MAG: OmpA family protein [Myxococcales bacterium]|jgi:ABC-type nitrate/sulfonate/bicarbonate transport system substrate-binding protein
MTQQVKPKGPFYVVLALVVIGLVGFALYRAGILAPEGKDESKISVQISKDDLNQAKSPIAEPAKDAVEAADSSAPTTVKEYSFVPEERLPAVQGVAGYKPLVNDTVKMALNVWAGWAPVIFANGGFKPNKEWTTPDGKRKFKLELVLIDDPVAMRDAYASGNVHIGWATVDMLPLFMEELKKDSRTMPRVFQQVDWSNGGDGIVARGGVESISGLRGKTVVLAQNSPSQYFVLNALINGGVQPAEVTFKYTGDAFQAAAAFAADKSIAAAVSWAPDIYNLSKVQGNKLIVTTADANRMIADVWFARADFAKENMPIVEALVRGFLEAADALDQQENKIQVSKWMAEGYNLPADETLGMLGDAHWTNYAENREFFLNQNNPTNFERTWDTAYYLYKRIGKVGEKVPWHQVVDFSIIQKLGSDPKFAKSQNKYLVNFAARSVSEIKAESGEILTKTIVVHFFPNSSNLKHKILKTVGDKTVEELYDPNVDFVVEEVGKMTGQYGAARIVIEGHTDSSMKGKVPFDAVQKLSDERAQAVRKAILEKFDTIHPNQISAEGMGWNSPADPSDPDNHAKNRRVEVKVYPLEAQQ